jgi:nitrogen fixation NifU-like protein
MSGTERDGGGESPRVGGAATREERLARLVDHYRHPRHGGRMDDGDIAMPGGNPGCGDVVTVYVKADADGARVVRASFEGRGCTISQASASILMQRVNRQQPTFSELAELPYEALLQELGPDLVGNRHQCAGLALGTLKAAVRALDAERRLAAAGYTRDQIAELVGRRDSGTAA